MGVRVLNQHWLSELYIDARRLEEEKQEARSK